MSAAAAIAVLVVGVVWVVVSRREPPPTPAAQSTATAGRRDVSTPPSRTRIKAPVSPADPVASDLERLRAIRPITGGPAERRIAGDPTQQPDLYAAEFVRRLLTQDYRAPRSEHLAWVQSESVQTSEPLVVGLVPKNLRGHLAVYSVTDSSGQTPAVPSPNEWISLGVQDGYTTVHVQRVDEPLAWSNAVSSGRISDPGITGREVAATVTLHYRKHGRPVTATSSVAMTLNIQGPPTRDTWGFVTAVTYSSLPVSTS